MNSARSNLSGEVVGAIIQAGVALATTTIGIVSSKIQSKKASEFEAEMLAQQAELDASQRELAELQNQSAAAKTSQVITLVGGGALLLGVATGGVLLVRKARQKRLERMAS